MTDQKTTGNGDSDIPLNDFKARRRLLKASAAAPLIATLAPATALAQTSLSCAEKSMDPLNPLQNLPSANASDDNAVRVEGKLWTDKKGGSNPGIYEVRGNYYLASDLSPTGAPPHSDYRDDPHFFVEYFSVNPDDGSISSAGTYPATQQGTLVSDSCLMSIAMHGQNIAG